MSIRHETFHAPTAAAAPFAATFAAFAAAMIAATAPPASAAGPIEVIFSEVPGDPTAVVPGARDLGGNLAVTEFKAMEVLSVSPDGSEWILKSRNHLGPDLETMLMRGKGLAGSMLAQEGQPVDDGAPGEVYEFFGSSPPHFNEVGQFVYTARARIGEVGGDQLGILFDGAALSVIRREGDPALGLLDLPPNPSGDEVFGNSFGSMHVLNDGTIGSHDTTILNIHSSRRPAIFYDDTAFMQVGVSEIEESFWDSLDLNDFWTTPDGTTWIAQGDDEEPTDSDDILVVNGAVVLREGSTIPGSGVVVGPNGIFHTKLLTNGDWFSRGEDPTEGAWAVRNGVLLAAAGEDVAVGSRDNWADVFVAFTGNRVGDWVLAGRTDAADVQADDVIVLNGETIVVREGDPVDLDGNGMFDDDVFIGRGAGGTSSAFHPDDIFLGDDRTLYFLAKLRDGAGNDLGLDGSIGDAFLRISLVDCPADFDGSDVVGFEDLLVLLASWGPCVGCPADLDGDDEVTFNDLLALLAAWGPC